MTERSYELEQLYVDQEPVLVADVIPPVLAWLQPSARPARHPFVFATQLAQSGHVEEHTLKLSWDSAGLEKQTPGTLDRARRIRTGRTADRERLAEVGAYALALVAISVWMPGRRACKFNNKMSPDILLDATDGALRGVEVAGRTRGGVGALRAIAEGSERRRGKRTELLHRADIVEAHLSLWCAAPRVSMFMQVKP